MIALTVFEYTWELRAQLEAQARTAARTPRQPLMARENILESLLGDDGERLTQAVQHRNGRACKGK